MAGGLYSEVQCIMGNGHIGTPSNPVNRQTRTKTLPSRNFVERRQQTFKRRRQPWRLSAPHGRMLPGGGWHMSLQDFPEMSNLEKNIGFDGWGAGI